MRRQDKEFTDRKLIDEILSRAVICTIAMNDESTPHIVPVNFGYQDNVIYLHSAPEGRKIDLLRKNPEVSFIVEDFHQIVTDELACGWSTKYRSVAGTGKIEIVTSNEEKRQGLNVIMEQHGAKGPYVYREGQLDRMVVLKLTIERITGKESGKNVELDPLRAELLEMAKHNKSLAETGLIFQDNQFDQGRYAEIKELSVKMIAGLTGNQPVDVEGFYLPVTDYPTPKVDVRGLVLNEAGEILMVRESVDGKWTLPGGWADVGLSPSQVVIREVQEEAGLTVTAERLLAVYDKRCHPHPPSPYYIYKLIFLCLMTGGDLEPGFDILDAAWVNPDNLPELSTDRILEGQIVELLERINEGKMETRFD
jgi:nitroimidazol reductase NimA-like FMN-containing flavoprotein (pyridoxamine 5'-phosphate oxidase superfamily)/ADP-ribose pyrophosphatase YjhB (NUDIX family)